jgi:cephalosporin hydroxylase
LHGDDIGRAVADAQRLSPAPLWRGVPCQQFCSDLWRYAELLHELRPPWVLECGTADGGTALFLADVLRSIGGEGRVISIDSDLRPVAVVHPRLELVKCDALDRGLVARAAGMAARGRGLVLLDDDHSSAHVAEELDAYAPFASYLVVEDTLMGHLGYADGPHLALAQWLPRHPEFAADGEPVPSNHPGGWLRRVAG